MNASRLGQLEEAVSRLLQRNAQLQDFCRQLLTDQEDWQQQRREMLTEVEEVLADLESVRKARA